MKMKSPLQLLAAVLLVFSSLRTFAQDSTMLPKHPPKERFIDRIFTGGNVGFQFGTVTYAEVSPLIGYRITDKIAAGVGVTYQYYHYKDHYFDLETNVYGARVFGRYMFTPRLFGYAEEEYLNLEAFDFQRRRVDVESFMAGGGYLQPIGENSAALIMLLYNFTPSAYTPYANPIIRIGFNIGF